MRNNAAVSDLAEFLRARLAEDRWVTYNPAFMPVTGPGLSDLVKRARAKTEAERRTVDLHGHAPHECVAWDELLGETCTCYEMACPTLRLLALPYADHPDYRPEWRP